MNDQSQPSPDSTTEPTGHYGPGYGDPTDVSPEAEPLPETTPGMKPERPAETTPDLSGGGKAGADSAPPMTSAEVETRPPDRAPSASAPESVNAALTLERS